MTLVQTPHGRATICILLWIILVVILAGCGGAPQEDSQDHKSTIEPVKCTDSYGLSGVCS